MIAENAAFNLDVPEKGVIDGHVVFTLKRPDAEDVGLVGVCANMISSVLFEKLHAQGSNIVLSLFGAKDVLHVVARNENDGLPLRWEPRQLSAEQLSDAAGRLSDAFVSLNAKRPQVVPEESPDEFVDEDEEQLKHLLRIP